MKLNKGNIEDLKELLATPKKIGIVSHRNPDGDAIGSSLGLFHYLSRLGHDATVAVPSDYPRFLNFLPGVKYVLVHDRDAEKAEKLFEEADIIFCLDFNALSRIDKLGEVIRAQSVPKVLVDHHLEPEDFAEFSLSETSASSTCELIYHLIDLLQDTQKVDEIIGTCLYTGILTDTGSFKYSTSPKLFHVAAALLETGVKDNELQNQLFNSQTIKQIRILGFALTRGMRLYPEYRTGLIMLSKHEFKRFNIQRGDTEGIVNYLLKMYRIRTAVLITEQNNIVKLSFRSKGNISVQEIASAHFNGGGHKNASGGSSKASFEETVKYFESLLPKYKDKLLVED